MGFLLLGPLEAYDGDRKLALGGAKQRALLAILLLHANEVVSSDRLIEALWGEDGSEDAAKALRWPCPGCARRSSPSGRRARRRTCSSRGRRATSPAGADQLDLHRFERLGGGPQRR